MMKNTHLPALGFDTVVEPGASDGIRHGRYRPLDSRKSRQVIWYEVRNDAVTASGSYFRPAGCMARRIADVMDMLMRAADSPVLFARQLAQRKINELTEYVKTLTYDELHKE